MKKIKKIVTSIMIIMIIISINHISNANEEKEKISEFINDKGNLIFSYYNYTEAKKMPIVDSASSVYGLAAEIARSYGKAVLDQPEDSEIYKLTFNMKARSFTKDDADQYTRQKLGIEFDELEGYEKYKETHSTSEDNNIFYQVLEGGGVFLYEEYTINNIKKLGNGNIEVEVANMKETSTGQQVELRNIVTLKPNGSSYLFISCEEYSDDYKFEESVDKEESNSLKTAEEIIEEIIDRSNTIETIEDNNATTEEQTREKSIIIILSIIILILAIILIIVIVDYKKYKLKNNKL